MPEEKILFDIPNCFMKVEFQKYKNENWKCSIINNNDNSRRMIIQSMKKDIMANLIEELTQNPNQFNKTDLKKSSKILKEKVEAMKRLTN